MKLRSRIEVPRPGVSVKIGSVTVGGTAWRSGEVLANGPSGLQTIDVVE